jgi:hypothetical protein
MGSRQAWQVAFEDADPAVHSLLHMLQRQGFSVPEIGVDINEPGSEVIFSNAELVWPDRKMIVVLEQDEGSERMKELGWTVQTVQSALDCLLPETHFTGRISPLSRWRERVGVRVEKQAIG